MFTANRKLILLFFASISTGLLIAISFPGTFGLKAGFPYLLPIALVPLLLAVESLPTVGTNTQRPRGKVFKVTTGLRLLLAFLLMWLSGIFIIFIGFFWLNTLIIQYAHFNYPTAYLLLLLYSIISGLFLPIILSPFLLECVRNAKKLAQPLPIWNISILVIGLEILLPHFFPWKIGNLFTFSTEINQWVSLFGVSIISFFIIFSNVLLVRLVKENYRGPIRYSLVIIFICTFWTIIYLLGLWKQSDTKQIVNLLQKNNIAVIQTKYADTNKAKVPGFFIKTNEKTIKNLKKIIDNFLTTNSNTKIDLIILPRNALPEVFTKNEDMQNELKNYVVQINIPILINTLIYNKELQSNNIILSEAFYLIKPDNSQTKALKKNKLIPFIEYNPLENNLSFLSNYIMKYLPKIDTWESGYVFNGFYYSPDFSVSTLPSLDVFNNKLAQELTEKGEASFFAIQVDFAWVYNTNAYLEFIELCKTLAIENGRSIVVASNFGPIIAFDATGNSIYTKKDITEDVSLISVPVVNKANFFETFYSKSKNIFIILFIILGILNMLYLLIFKKNK